MWTNLVPSEDSPNFVSTLAYISVSETSENGKEASFLLKHVQVKRVQILHKCLNKQDTPTSLKKTFRQLINITHFWSFYLPLVFCAHEYKVPSQKL